MTLQPTPTQNSYTYCQSDFVSIAAALDYAAAGSTGFNFYDGRGQLYHVLTYQKLHMLATNLARGLIAQNLPVGSRFLLIADTVPEFMILFFACQYASLIAVPVALPVGLGSKESYTEGLRRQLQDCGAIMAAAPKELLDFLTAASAGLNLKLLGSFQSIIDLAKPHGNIRPWRKADDPCYLQYSSGSTRFPRGIDLRQSTVMSNLHAISKYGVRMGAEDRITSWLPLYHDMGIVGCTLTPFANQLSVDFMATRDFAKRPMLWLELVSRNKSTITYGPSFAYNLCARRASSTILDDLKLNLTSLRVAGIGADMIQAKVLNEFAQVFARSGFNKTAFLASYGMAEAALALTFAKLGTGIGTDYVDREKLVRTSVAEAVNQEHPNCQVFVTCGHLLPGYQLEIRSEDGQVLDARRQGKIYVKGPSIMKGYFNQPEATMAVLSADGWLDTGDLGYKLASEEIVITGRSKDLIIINGRNIWPQDIEWTLEELPEIRKGDAAAFAVNKNDEEKIIILIECRLKESTQRQKLVQEAEAAVRRAHGVETQVVLVPVRSLPYTSSGKLSRSKAKAAYLTGQYS